MKTKLLALGLIPLLMPCGGVEAHETGAAGVKSMHWHPDAIARTVSASYSWNDLGITTLSQAGKTVEQEGETCLHGSQFGFDVRDTFAFDIDETVTLTLDLDLDTSGSDLGIAYDRNGGPGHLRKKLPGKGRRKLSINLPRARFAGRGDHGTDFKIIAGKMRQVFGGPPPLLTICNIQIERSFETVPTPETGALSLRVVDENGNLAPVRAGLYDSTGRSVLPSSDAVAIQKFSDRTRTYLLQGYTTWPSNNRFVMYMDGEYLSSLPAGTYRFVATRGIEYRFIDEEVTIKPGKTTKLTAKLKRFANQPGKGWYSGDVHIHLARRDDRDGKAALLQVTAEDLSVGNLLRMGNIGNAHFPQAGWGKAAGRVIDGSHSVVSGQEGPRTSSRGHTIHLNIEEPVRYPDAYLLYHRVFEEIARQGGVSGYAHVQPGGSINGRVGMALDVPFGNVKFAEVAQMGMIATDPWFDFLNLGFRIAPAAGTDYPYIGHPGDVRSYVRTGRGFSVDDWFGGLSAGHTFVTTGPLIDMSANGTGIGGQLDVATGESISIRIDARLNPDIDDLARIELIEQGEVIASIKAKSNSSVLELNHEMTATHSTWIVARAYGSKSGPGAAAAMTAPVYIAVDGNINTSKRSAVPGLVERYKGAIDALAASRLANALRSEGEGWETAQAWIKSYEAQLAALQARMDAAKERLDAIALEAEAE